MHELLTGERAPLSSEELTMWKAHDELKAFDHETRQRRVDKGMVEIDMSQF